ncbi:MAG: hypothetical protein M3Z75_17935 [Actinomycetota bacterium]|nr:hypothetical protein [Actinomycetota bacterium]
MTVPAYLAVAQWALLMALGFLVIIMYRQLGRVFGKNKVVAKAGPAPGTKAVGFEYRRLSDETRQDFTPGGGQPAFVAFVDPTCPACEQLVDSLGADADAGELAGFRVLLLTSDPPGYLQISETFTATRLELGTVMTRAAREAYNPTATPLLVAIDGEGVVRAAGPAREPAEVRVFRQACLLPPPETTLTVVPGSPRRDEKDKAATPAAGSE